MAKDKEKLTTEEKIDAIFKYQKRAARIAVIRFWGTIVKWVIIILIIVFGGYAAYYKIKNFDYQTFIKDKVKDVTEDINFNNIGIDFPFRKKSSENN